MTTNETKDGPMPASEHRFQAEVSRVLDIVIHSLYSHPEIFLRELVSNAADALDKLRFRAITEHELLGEDKDLEIRIIPDKNRGTLTIEDNGIGMTRDELVSNLGTIARSGSRAFLETLKAKGGQQAGPELIGQFGVGFYSSFIVADEVAVRSRAAGSDQPNCWTSRGAESFRIEPALEWERRGTNIELKLKDEFKEFLDPWRLRELIRKYSDFVSFPIKLLTDEKKEDGFEVINRAGALWKRPKHEITDTDYEEFYKHIAHDWEAPLDRVHFQVEGTIGLTGLLFIPKHPARDLFDPEGKRGVRLYVRRVFIMEDCEHILPRYLRFIRGVVDSDDLPLNVSRELLQEDKVVRSIRKTVTAKILGAIEKLASDRPDDYKAFWPAFGPVLKEGLHFDRENHEKLAELLRYASTASESASLAEYVSRMPEGQDVIYYAFGQSRRAVEGSPHLEGLKKAGKEVLMMTDAIDEWVVDALREYKGKKLVSAMKADLQVGNTTESQKTEAQAKAQGLEGLLKRAEEVLDESVSSVRASTRLTDSPSCLVVPEGGVHAHIERMLRAQGEDLPASKRILELNPDHPIVVRLKILHATDEKNPEVAEWLQLLHDQALLAEGSPLLDPQRFARQMTRLMSQALNT